MKFSPLLATILLTVCAERASAQVNLFNIFGSSTTGSVVFNDLASGGVSTTVTASALVGDQPMNLLSWMGYASTGFPHVDSASMNVDITQAPGGPGSMPWFAATASLSQTANVNGDTAFLNGSVQTGFEGIMTGVNPTSLLPLLGYAINGVIGTNSGAFATLTAQLDYYELAGPFIGSLFWNQTVTGAGPFAMTVFPTWVGGPVLTSNLITVNGFINLQADPSSISITPATAVPEPTAWVSLFLGAATLANRRRRAN